MQACLQQSYRFSAYIKGDPNMNMIAAVDSNWAIGNKNKLLISIPADMKMFRQETTGKVVVMGRKTLESFPNQKLQISTAH